MIGRHSFEYAIIPHRGGWSNAYPGAYAFNAPLRALSTSIHPGKLPRAMEFVWVEPKQFVIRTVKAAEKGNGWIVRGYNLGSETIIVTVRPWRPFARAARVTLAEKTPDWLVPAPDGGVQCRVQGHEIVTIRFEDPA